jgi:hypothetical protein
LTILTGKGGVAIVVLIWYNSHTMENKPTSYRLPEKVKILIHILSEKLLISKTAVITLAVLDYAKKKNISIKDKE